MLVSSKGSKDRMKSKKELKSQHPIARRMIARDLGVDVE